MRISSLNIFAWLLGFWALVSVIGILVSLYRLLNPPMVFFASITYRNLNTVSSMLGTDIFGLCGLIVGGILIAIVLYKVRKPVGVVIHMVTIACLAAFWLLSAGGLVHFGFIYLDDSFMGALVFLSCLLSAGWMIVLALRHMFQCKIVLMQ